MTANTTLTLKMIFTDGRLNINGMLYITSTGKIDSAALSYPEIEYVGSDPTITLPKYMSRHITSVSPGMYYYDPSKL